MTQIHSGAVLERPPGPKYLKALGFAELSTHGPLPKISTLKRWREQVPEDFVFSLVAPKAARESAQGPLRFDESTEQAFEWTLAATKALGARFLVLPTDGRTTTGQRDRDRLSSWVEKWAPAEETQIVWHPTGLWDPELSRPFARKLGILWGFDPLITDVPADPIVYGRLKSIGARRRFTETHLLDILDGVEMSGAEEAWISFESERSFQEASRMSAVAGAGQEEED